MMLLFIIEFDMLFGNYIKKYCHMLGEVFQVC